MTGHAPPYGHQGVAGHQGTPGYQGAYVHRAAAGNARATRGALAVAAFIGAGLLLLVSLAFIAGEAGPVGLLIGIFTAVLPAPIYLALALRVDRYEPEPFRMLAGAFAWGATASFLIAFIVNSIGTLIVSGSLGAAAGSVYGGVISAPIVEESAKAVVLFAIYRFRRNEFNGVLDGIVYAAMVALGFATTENILYYGRTFATGEVPVETLFFLRGVLFPFSHPLFTAMTGLGLGIAVGSRSSAARIRAPLAGLVAAMFLHAVWNGTAAFGAIFIAYVIFFIPVFIAMIVVVVVASRRELRLVGTYLQHDVGTGLIPGHELGTLASAGARRRAVRAAAASGGAAKRARKRFHVAATELALHRHKVATGAYAGTSPHEDDIAYQQELRDLQPQFGGAAGQASSQALGPQGQPAAPASASPPKTGQPTAATPAAAAVGSDAGATHPAAGLAPAAGWHPDPYGQARLRWWDGSRWTEHTAV